MKRVIIFVVTILLFCGNVFSHDKPFAKIPAPKDIKPVFFIQHLASDNKYQPLLESFKNSIGLEAGRVIKTKGESGEKHSTKIYEEILIVLEGKGYIEIEGDRHSLSEGDVVYIPPQKEHQLGNEKNKRFEYVYVAAPTLKAFH